MNRPKALDLFCGDGGATKGLQRAGFYVVGVDIRPRPRYCGDEFIQADALNLSPEYVRTFDFGWASPPCQAFTALRHMPTAKEHPDLIPQTRGKLAASGIPYCIENVEGAPLGGSGFLIMLCGTMFGLQTADGSAELRRHRLFETSFSIPLRPACQHGYISRPHGTINIYGEHVHVSSEGNHRPVKPADNRNRDAISVCGEGLPVGSRLRETISVTGTGMGKMLDGRKTVSVVGHGSPGIGNQCRAITVTGSTPQTNVIKNRVRRTFTVQQAREAMGIDWMPMASLSQAVPPAYAEFIGVRALNALAG